MKVDVLRGENQIGGNIIEVSTATTKILLDAGLSLDNEQNAELPDINGLFDSKGYDAVFISHYHGDHIGLAYEICKDIPLYIGEGAYQVITAANTYLEKENLSPASFLRHNEAIKVGDITITPFLCDHSAFDSYMLLVEGDGEKVLYTGDFRSNGRKKYNKLLNELPEVDTLICEGTTLLRTDGTAVTESELEETAVDLFRVHTGPVFILQSATNIDRIVTMYRAAKRSGRLFLQDLYMACITDAVGKSIPNPNGFTDVRVFVTKPYGDEHFRRILFNRFGGNKIGRARIAKESFVMCVRSSMIGYLKSLHKEMSFENGLLIYSFWGGYKAQPQVKEFISTCEELGLKVVSLHTTGHADANAITQLIDTVKPKNIIPVHTENAAWFESKEYKRVVF